MATTETQQGSAGMQGDLWGARAGDWADFQEPAQRGIYEQAVELSGIRRRTRVLDVGCGAGGFLRLANARGYAVAGFDYEKRMIELARKNGVTDVLGHAIAYRAVALARIGDFAAARQQIAEALDQLPLTPSPVKRADIHIAVGMALHDMGAFEESLKHARLGAELAEGARGMECACAGYLGVGSVQVERNEIADARDKFERSLKYADIAGFEQFRNVIQGGVAFTEFELGSDAAIEQMRVAIANARSSNDGYAEATMSEKLATALLRLGRRDEAGEAIAAALNYYRNAGMRPFLANALGLAGRVYDASGEPDRAAAARSEAAAITASLKATGDSAHMAEA